jgi:hypothetical protein
MFSASVFCRSQVQKKTCRTQALQGGPKRRWIEQICRDRRHAGNVSWWPPHQSRHLPTSFTEMQCEIVAYDATCSNDEYRLRHVPIPSRSSWQR